MADVLNLSLPLFSISYNSLSNRPLSDKRNLQQAFKYPLPFLELILILFGLMAFIISPLHLFIS